MVSHIKDSSTKKALNGIRRIVQALHESSRDAERRLGVSGAQLFVLQKLSEQPRISLNELAALTHTHQSSVSVVVARLADRKLVRRRRAESDGRRLELEVTTAGRRLAVRAPDAAQDKLIAAIVELPTAERAQFAALLNQLAAAMDIHRAPRMFFETRGQ